MHKRGSVAGHRLVQGYKASIVALLFATVLSCDTPLLTSRKEELCMFSREGAVNSDSVIRPLQRQTGEMFLEGPG